MVVELDEGKVFVEMEGMGDMEMRAVELSRGLGKFMWGKENNAVWVGSEGHQVWIAMTSEFLL